MGMKERKTRNDRERGRRHVSKHYISTERERVDTTTSEPQPRAEDEWKQPNTKKKKKKRRPKPSSRKRQSKKSDLTWHCPVPLISFLFPQSFHFHPSTSVSPTLLLQSLRPLIIVAPLFTQQPSRHPSAPLRTSIPSSQTVRECCLYIASKV
jgi:hypothetical protein